MGSLFAKKEFRKNYHIKFIDFVVMNKEAYIVLYKRTSLLGKLSCQFSILASCIANSTCFYSRIYLCINRSNNGSEYSSGSLHQMESASQEWIHNEQTDIRIFWNRNNLREYLVRGHTFWLHQERDIREVERVGTRKIYNCNPKMFGVQPR